MLSPFPSLTASSAGRLKRRQRWTRAFQPGRGADEHLRWSVTPAAKREATLSQMRPQARFAVLLRRRTLPHVAGRSRSRIPRGKEISASVSEVRSAGISGWMRGKSHSGNRSDEPELSLKLEVTLGTEIRKEIEPCSRVWRKPIRQGRETSTSK